ncbi:MAG: histidine kinase [Streptococcaceae bacterium]|jgi:signal transduction histidine kinase|nr:histidine kinase [Streptococcaceae bacterium]
MERLKWEICYLINKIIGFGLLIALWIFQGQLADLSLFHGKIELNSYIDFLMILLLIATSIMRWGTDNYQWTYLIEVVPFLLLFLAWGWLVLPFSLLALILPEIYFKVWASERQKFFINRDHQASKFYEMAHLQGDLLASQTQIERMTAVSERARISREIHDNAGHEIVGAFISLQALRDILTSEEDLLEMYDLSLERLDSGVKKMRDVVHNMAPIQTIGIETLENIIEKYPLDDIQFRKFGDMTSVPIYVWNLLESLINESLTNIARHADAKQVKINLDVTTSIVRLQVENDGSKKKVKGDGIGLRNMRQRATAVGGNLSIDAGEIFRVTCVVPMN